MKLLYIQKKLRDFLNVTSTGSISALVIKRHPPLTVFIIELSQAQCSKLTDFLSVQKESIVML